MTGEFSYAHGVTDSELWIAVGEQLLLRRNKLGLKPFDIDKAGGPNYTTVSAIERGEVGRISSVEKYAETIGLSVVSVLRSVLCADRALSPEAQQIVSKYEQTTVAGRTALLTTAQALPVEPAPRQMPEAPNGPSETTPGRRSSGSGAQRTRGKK